ncbi:hypothetical protein Tco_0660560 [Tanacetum coccineum]
MLAICNTDEPVPLKAPKPSLQTEMKEPKAGAPKRPAGSHKAYLKKRKESSQAMDSNPSRPPISTPVDTGLRKEVRQEAGGPNSLGVTGEEGANPQLSSGMSAFTKLMPTYLTSVICHSKSASGNDALADSTAKADPGTSAPNNSLPP